MHMLCYYQMQSLPCIRNWART